MATEVNEVSSAVKSMGREWPMLDALMGGTLAMRDAGEAFLPKWPNEEPASWKKRCDTATLFPAYRRTISVMAGKPFSKSLTLGDDVDPQIEEWAEDIDREGVNLHTFAAEMFAEGFYGLAGILVEAPKPIETSGRVPTMAEQKAAGVRPYLVRVRHGQILGWRVSEASGARVLTQLRILESVMAEDGEFGEKCVERVRVLVPGAWALYEKQEAVDGQKPKWIEVDQGNTGLTYIPFVPIYGRRLGFMSGAPPLVDLAHLNVKHWQSQSDQDTILHVARVPILAVIGIEDTEWSMTIGAATATRLPLGAELKYVEHTGAAITMGQASLTALEDQMIQAGAELLVKKPGDRSATESANDAEANKCDLQRMVESFEDSLDTALSMMADYAGLAEGGHVSLYKDFGAATLSDASAQLIMAMEQGGLISRDTAINEFKRRGTLAAEVSAEDEDEKIAAQAPALGLMGDPALDPANPEPADPPAAD